MVARCYNFGTRQRNCSGRKKLYSHVGLNAEVMVGLEKHLASLEDTVFVGLVEFAVPDGFAVLVEFVLVAWVGSG